MKTLTLETKSTLEVKQNSKFTLENIMIAKENYVNDYIPNLTTRLATDYINFTIIGEELLF